MNYIFYAILAYLLFAGNGVADKFMLSKVVSKPVVYAFFVGILSCLAVLLAPFGLHMLALPNLLIAFLAGSLFTYALYFFYAAIQETSISRILPIEGGFVPVFTLVFSKLILDEYLPPNQIMAFSLLVAGSVLISIKKNPEGVWRPRALKNALLAAFLFALSLTIMKFVYQETNFISGIIWTRLGLGIGALTFLMTKNNRQAIFSTPRQTSGKHQLLFYSSHIMGTAGSLLQNYAIAIGSVVIVSALQGVQFVFVLAMGVVLSLYFPKVIKETITAPILAQKLLAIIFISLGLYLLR